MIQTYILNIINYFKLFNLVIPNLSNDMKKKLSIFLIAAISFSGCELFTDPCKDITCLNGGNCLDGTCLCDDYYEGPNCEKEEREKYFGTYAGNTTYSDSQGNTNTYADTKEISPSIQGISFFDLSGIYGSLDSSGASEFSIPTQGNLNPGSTDSSFFSGFGSFSGNSASWTVTVESNGSTVTMSFTGNK